MAVRRRSLFTGSHGAEWSIADPAIQRERQGALVTQEWTRGQPLAARHYLSGAEASPPTRVRGMIAFVFACFGGGCPGAGSYFFAPDGLADPAAPGADYRPPPQALLGAARLRCSRTSIARSATASRT